MTNFKMFETNKTLRNLNFENLNLFLISIFGFRIFQLEKNLGSRVLGFGEWGRIL